MVKLVRPIPCRGFTIHFNFSIERVLCFCSGHPVAEMSTILTHNSGKHGTVRYKLLYGMENSIPSDGKSVSNPFGGKSTPGTPWVDLNEDTGSLTLNRRLNRERDCVDKGAVCSVQFQVCFKESTLTHCFCIHSQTHRLFSIEKMHNMDKGYQISPKCIIPRNGSVRFNH